MPLTEFQSGVLRVISGNRSAESHVAGGIVLNADASSPRFSKDIDIFHDAIEALAAGSAADCASLEKAGYQVERHMWVETFRRIWVSRDGEKLRVEWAQDSAWRFFPVERDPVLGWKLHRFDALTNKALAMSSRNETRDMVDLVSNHDAFPLHVVVWAACSKDPGFNPMSLLEQMRRFSRIDAPALLEMQSSFTSAELKQRWLRMAEDTGIAITAAADQGIEPGVVFLAPDGSVKWFDTPGATIHRATLGGVIPRLGGVHY